MNFHGSCDGFCGPKDWEPLIEKNLFSDRKIQKILLEERTKNSHLRVLETGSERTPDDTVFVVFAQWRATADAYLYCEAMLEEQYRPTWRAFAAACAGMREIR
jgi:hypothetical protein